MNNLSLFVLASSFLLFWDLPTCAGRYFLVRLLHFPISLAKQAVLLWGRPEMLWVIVKGEAENISKVLKPKLCSPIGCMSSKADYFNFHFSDLR